MVAAIFSLSIFVGSFLLFLIQPMVGKLLLPAMGGAPAVWITCMLFFQLMLLGGYLYAEKALRYLGSQRQSTLHILLMTGGFILLPLNIDISAAGSAVNNPVTWLMIRLSASIGFLFFMISANAPLLQRYYSQAGQTDSHDPYFLYAASNTGSLLALLAYPLLIEPFMTLTVQRQLWSALYVLQTCLVTICCLVFWQTGQRRQPQNISDSVIPAAAQSQATWRQSLFWCLMGFVPCSAMLAVTTHISTDIASLPLLWVIPLSLYLISFILVFARSPRWREIRWENYMYPTALMAMIMYYLGLVERMWLTIPLHLLAMFLVCMYFHGRLANDRPAPVLLNSFYVWMSVGGVVGGLFNSILAPMLLATQAEYLLTLIVAVILASVMSRKLAVQDFSLARKCVIYALFLLAMVAMAWLDEGNMKRFAQQGGIFLVPLGLLFIDAFFRMQKLVWVPLVILLAAGPFVQMKKTSDVVFTARSFFGVLKVARVTNQGKENDRDLAVSGLTDIFYTLQHGTTMHGIERRITSMRRAFPLAYYSRESPIGAAFRAGLVERRFRQVGVVGLGVGTLAWYGRPWQHFDFFEIDPKVVEIAEDAKLFTYLAKSKASWKNHVGDARVVLQGIPDHKYDLLVLDAYSSDAIPLHLMTIEAFRLYQSKTRPDGLMLFHVSNNYFDLAPVIKRICDELGLYCLISRDITTRYSLRYDWYDFAQIFNSQWVAVASDPSAFAAIKRYQRWEEIVVERACSLWTDDYANLFQAFSRR
ncbi:MAG TPA: hypothetical protein DCG57_17190 [Candidatus Riflebacteria bacterium]|jgi:hypothetical protein|nr:hypothetical protein [Candidatus Riflebacteria bacterium]